MKKHLKTMVISMAFVVSCQTSIRIISDDVSPQEEQYFHYLKALYQHETGKKEKALEHFEKLLSQPAPADIYEGFIHFLFESQLYEALLQLPPTIWDYFSDNVEIELIRVQSLLRTQGHKHELDTMVAQLLAKYPDNEHVVYYALVYYVTCNGDKAHQLIEQSTKKDSLHSQHYLYHFLNAKMLHMRGNSRAALVALEKSLVLAPGFTKSILLKALLLEKEGLVDESIEHYQKYVNSVHGDPSVSYHLVKLLCKKQSFDCAVKVLNGLSVHRPHDLYNISFLELKSGRKDAALQTVNRLLKRFPLFVRAHQLKIKILVAMQDLQGVEASVQAWLVDFPHERQGYEALLQLKKTLFTWDTTYRIIENVVKKTPNNPLAHWVLGDLYLEKNRYEKALKAYKNVSVLLSDSEICSQLFYQIGYIYFITNKHEKLERVLAKSLKLTPNYAPSCNLLAYHYAEKQKNLDEALRLSQVALKAQEPKTAAAYLDTHGLVLFQQGQYKEAMTVLKSALDYDQNNKVIQNHMRLIQGYMSRAIKRRS